MDSFKTFFFWLWFTLRWLMYTVWFTINSPLRLIVSLVQLKLHVPFEYVTTKLGMVKDTAPIYKACCKYMNPQRYADDNDGAKFVGLMTINPTHGEKAWEFITSLFGKDSFYRRPNKDIGTNFSGDMTSGMMLGIYHRCKTVGLTKDETTKLTAIFKSVILKHFFRYPHEDTSRGTILPWYAVGSDWGTSMAVCKVAYTVTKQPIYKALYYWLLVLGIPNRFIAPWHGFHAEKFKIINWYTVDSGAICEFINDSKFVFSKLVKAAPWNLNILAMGVKLKIVPAKDVYTLLKVFDPFDKNSDLEAYPEDKLIKVFDIKDFRFEPYAKEMVPFKYRGHNCIWERSPIEAKCRTKVDPNVVDYTFAYNLVFNIGDTFKS